jgi:hypothetical protein
MQFIRIPSAKLFIIIKINVLMYSDGSIIYSNYREELTDLV